MQNREILVKGMEKEYCMLCYVCFVCVVGWNDFRVHRGLSSQ
jgi:hypothetical protein